MGLKLIRVANTLIQSTLQQGNVGASFYVDDGLPVGAKLQNVVMDSQYTTFSFEHESFPDTPPDQMYPYLEPRFYEYHSIPIRNIDIHPGDVLVLRSRVPITSRGYAALRESLNELLPDVSMMLLENGMTVDSVLCRQATGARNT